MLDMGGMLRGDLLLKKDKYNKVLNKLGKNPIAYSYSYEKTRTLCLSLNGQTKSLIIYILKRELEDCKVKELAYILNVSQKSYRQNIIRLKEDGVLEEYKLLYKDMVLRFYHEYLIR